MPKGGIVVADQVYLQVFRNLAVNVTQEREELLTPVALRALGQHCAVCSVERGKQGGSSMANVVMGDSLRYSPTLLATRRALEGLHLGLLVHTLYLGVLGRDQIEPDDIAYVRMSPSVDSGRTVSLCRSSACLGTSKESSLRDATARRADSDLRNGDYLTTSEYVLDWPCRSVPDALVAPSIVIFGLVIVIR
jgi:hypothetical protein